MAQLWQHQASCGLALDNPQRFPPQDLAAWQATAQGLCRMPGAAQLRRIQPPRRQRLAPTRDLVTQSFSGASTRDGSCAKRGHGRSGKPRSDNSGSPVSRASGADWTLCWLPGTQPLSNISGGRRSADWAYISRRKKDTCVFGSVSWTDMMTHNCAHTPQVFRRE
jgi:hypothetical protein